MRKSNKFVLLISQLCVHTKLQTNIANRSFVCRKIANSGASHTKWSSSWVWRMFFLLPFKLYFRAPRKLCVRAKTFDFCCEHFAARTAKRSTQKKDSNLWAPIVFLTSAIVGKPLLPRPRATTTTTSGANSIFALQSTKRKMQTTLCAVKLHNNSQIAQIAMLILCANITDRQSERVSQSVNHTNRNVARRGCIKKWTSS